MTYPEIQAAILAQVERLRLRHECRDERIYLHFRDRMPVIQSDLKRLYIGLAPCVFSIALEEVQEVRGDERGFYIMDKAGRIACSFNGLEVEA